MRDGFDLTDTRLYTVVDPDGGLPEVAAHARSPAAVISPPTARRSPTQPLLTRDFRTWKRYQGGWAQDLYTFDLNDRSLSNRSPTTPAPTATRCGSATAVCYASDRDGKLNLYAYDLGVQATTLQLTDIDRKNVRSAGPTTGQR